MERGVLSNRTLADFDDLIQLLDAYNFLVLAGTRLCLIELCCQPFVEISLMREDFSRAGHAGHCCKGPRTGILALTFFRLFCCAPLTVSHFPLPSRRVAGTGINFLPLRYCPVTERVHTP